MFVLHVGAEPLAADLLDQPADPVDRDAVVPLLARVEHQRLHRPGRRVGVVERREGPVRLGRLRHLQQIGVPLGVGHARGVGHQVAQRDPAVRRAQHRLVAVPAVEHLELGRVGQPVRDRRVEVELALLDQLHRAGAGDRLGHRGHVADGVLGHRHAAAELPLAEGGRIDRLLGVGDRADHADDVAALDGRAAAPRRGSPRARLLREGVRREGERRARRGGAVEELSAGDVHRGSLPIRCLAPSRWSGGRRCGSASDRRYWELAGRLLRRPVRIAKLRVRYRVASACASDFSRRAIIPGSDPRRLGAARSAGVTPTPRRSRPTSKS